MLSATFLPSNNAKSKKMSLNSISFWLQFDGNDGEKATPNPIPCSHICLAATCSQAKMFGPPSVRPSRRSRLGRSSMSSSPSGTCCSPTAFDCWSSPSGSSMRVCCSCWGCTDCTDYARSCMTRDWEHTTVDCERSLVEWSAVMELSWWTSSSPAAWDCRPFDPTLSWCWDMKNDGPWWCPNHCLWDCRSQTRPLILA